MAALRLNAFLEARANLVLQFRIAMLLLPQPQQDAIIPTDFIHAIIPEQEPFAAVTVNACRFLTWAIVIKLWVNVR